METSDLILQAAYYLDNDPDKTNELCIEVLEKDPDNPKALFLMATVLLRAEKNGLGYNLLKRAVELAPKQAPCWNNLGMVSEGLERYEEARRYFEKAASLDPNTLDFQSNIAMVAMQQGKYQEAKKLSDKLLKIDPDHPGSNMTNGFSSLALGDWEPGWKGYKHTLGTKYRVEADFGYLETEWDGRDYDTLAVYAEQGLGDEIMFANCLNSLSGDVVFECDERLTGLFKRSFPKVNVYGTRRSDRWWLAKHRISHKIALADLPRFTRNKNDDFPRKPFLTADPERRLMWRTLFDTYKKPVIGLAWSGGRPNTGATRREVGIDAFRPLIEARDAVYISLQYRDPRKEIEASGMPIKHFSVAESKDYDDLAAMVAELDEVIGIHTASLHLSGGLGVKTTALVPSKCSWAYKPNEMLWYPDTYKIHRQKEGEKWEDTIKRLTKT